MKKIISLVMCAITAALLILSMASCSQPTSQRFPHTQSGFKFEISEAVLSIQPDFTFGKEKDGYVPSADIEVEISGYEELSYFDGQVTLVWRFEYLTEDGKYEDADYTVTIGLDADGTGSHEESITFDGCRSVKNLTLELEFDGYAVKK